MNPNSAPQQHSDTPPPTAPSPIPTHLKLPSSRLTSNSPSSRPTSISAIPTRLKSPPSQPPQTSAIPTHLKLPPSRPTYKLRHPDRRRRTLPPQWRDPRISPLLVSIRMSFPQGICFSTSARHPERSAQRGVEGPRRPRHPLSRPNHPANGTYACHSERSEESPYLPFCLSFPKGICFPVSARLFCLSAQGA